MSNSLTISWLICQSNIIASRLLLLSYRIELSNRLAYQFFVSLRIEIFQMFSLYRTRKTILLINLLNLQFYTFFFFNPASPLFVIYVDNEKWIFCAEHGLVNWSAQLSNESNFNERDSGRRRNAWYSDALSASPALKRCHSLLSGSQAELDGLYNRGMCRPSRVIPKT